MQSIVLISAGILFIVISQLVRRRGLDAVMGGKTMQPFYWIGYAIVGVIAICIGIASLA